jgi:molybdopterin synthase catalytic subunit
MAERELERIAAAAFERWGARLAILHRVGRVPVGEASLVVAAAAPHRREAFEACAFAVDEIKKQAPIWKVEYEEAGAPG